MTRAITVFKWCDPPNIGHFLLVNSHFLRHPRVFPPSLGFSIEASASDGTNFQEKVGFHKWQSPIAGWFIIENPIKYMNMDDDWTGGTHMT